MADSSTTDSSTSSGAVATRPSATPAPPKVDHLPPWRVLLHNDDHNEMLEVVRVIQLLTHLPAREAFTRMLEGPTRGVLPSSW